MAVAVRNRDSVHQRKKNSFSVMRGKNVQRGATGIPSFSFQIQFVIDSLCCSQAQQAQAIYIDDYDFE